MSDISAALITDALSKFDAFVRTALREGDVERVKGMEMEIVRPNTLGNTKRSNKLHRDWSTRHVCA